MVGQSVARSGDTRNGGRAGSPHRGVFLALAPAMVYPPSLAEESQHAYIFHQVLRSKVGLAALTVIAGMRGRSQRPDESAKTRHPS